MILVTITERLLREHKACDEGIALWRSIAEMSPRSPRGVMRVKVRWTRLHQLWAATAYPSFWAWLRDKSLAPQISLGGADLSGADLSGADLSGADLSGANLYGANLGDADLYGANLYGANLYGANLYDADLRGANLYDADLRGANLGDADLYGANLGDADLYGANLGDYERGPDGFARRKT